MSNVIITNEMYTEFIENTIATEGWKVADTANKLALKSGNISTEQYSTAAQIIVEAYLAQ